MKIPDRYNYEDIRLTASLDENISNIRRILSDSSDLLLNPFIVSGVRCNLLCFEGMVSTSTITNLILNPITELSLPENITSQELFTHIRDHMLLTVDRAVTTLYGDLVRRLMSGFAVILIDGCDSAFSLGVQGYAVRGIDEPSSEGNIYGAHEGFVETVRTNMSLVRRRIKSPLLVFELFPITTQGKTDVIVAYMADRAPKKLVRRIKNQLKNIPAEAILTSGYAEAFLNNTKFSLFSGTSKTERPDVFCAKLLEGRVGVLIEGTPFAIVTPALFTEHFQTLDDYTFRPYYATFLRLVRFGAFFAAVFLPGVYTAIVTFHPGMFNFSLLVTLCEAEKTVPVPIMLEVMLVLLFYEVIREAGVRLPKSVGGAVSVVGGLIIGDTAVSAGIISNPVLLVCAMSVTASFVIPSLNQPVTVLRLICVLAGGTLGLYGTGLLAAVTLINICSLENDGVPVTSPITPFSRFGMRDTFVRAPFRVLFRKKFTIGKK